MSKVQKRIVHPLEECGERFGCQHGLEEPGAHLGPPALPNQDAHAYPVLIGPPAFLPAELSTFEPEPGPDFDPAAVRRTWPEDKTEATFPAPLVTSSDQAEGPAKRAVTTLVKEMESAGWSVKVTYAKGWTPNASTGRPSAQPKESLAVRASRAGQRAVAAYFSGSSWSWETLYVWTDGQFPDKHANITTFRKAVLEGWAVP